MADYAAAARFWLRVGAVGDNEPSEKSKGRHWG